MGISQITKSYNSYAEPIKDHEQLIENEHEQQNEDDDKGQIERK